MLWYKNWLETRFRLVFVGVMFLFFVTVNSWAVEKMPASQTGQKFVLGLQGLYCLIAPLFLAGTGVETQSTIRPAKGLQSSTLFTLSLPVTRFRLLAVRSALGIAELFTAIAAIYVTAWVALPRLRTFWPVRDDLKYLLAVFVCLWAFYFLFVVIAALVRDEFTRNWTCMVTAGSLWWLSGKIHVRPSLNLLLALGNGSPLFTHTLPWAAMAVSIVASVVFFLIALKIVESREY